MICMEQMTISILLRIIGQYLLGIWAIQVCLWILWEIGQKDPDWHLRLSRRERRLLLWAGGLSAAAVVRAEPAADMGRTILLGAFAGCLLTACVMDLKEQMVYRYVWLAAYIVVAAMGMSCLRARGELSAFPVRDLLLFCVLQFALFGQMYGRADCFAFCGCAGVLCTANRGFADDVFHMVVTFGLLTGVQLLRRNVTAAGRLRKPVPMLPYITAGFWLWVDFGLRK